MISFLAGIAILILGYIFYGRFVVRRFGASPERVTPAKRLADGVDYKELKPWKIFVIQFLNIAGLGPIFGAILGAAYGPVSYIWIALGCVFMGATHDFFSGMLSVRNNGMSIPDIIGKYLGKGMRLTMVVLLFIFLTGVGSSFVIGPADLLATLSSFDKTMWVIIIFVYYMVATIFPIDKIIGNIYPFFGALLIFMALSIFAVLVYKGFAGDITLVELTPATFKNFHSNPESNVLVPMLCIVLSCGAVSGFHSTQSPIMARCLSNEKYGRPIFYGAMITEGIVAMIWATAAMAFFGGPEGLNAAADGVIAADGTILAAPKTPAIIINEICSTWLGKFGSIIAILGVIVCPITSGDTAFRSIRLMGADALKINQKPIIKRLLTAAPIFVVAFLACSFDFSTIWKYVGIGNQMLATICLWSFSSYLYHQRKNHWITSIPATILTFICISYFLIAPHNLGGMSIDPSISYVIGIITATGTLIAFLLLRKPTRRKLKKRFEKLMRKP